MTSQQETQISYQWKFHDVVTILFLVLLGILSGYRLWITWTQAIIPTTDPGVFAEMTRVLIHPDLTIYIDIWDHKPPGLFFFTAPFILLMGTTPLAIQTTAIAIVLMFTHSTLLIVRQYTESLYAIAIAVIISLFMATIIVYSRSIETVLLMTTFANYAIYFVIARDKPSWFLVIGGLFYTFAFISKQPIATAFPILLWFTFYHSPPGTRFKRIFYVLIGCTLGVLLILAWSLASGNLWELWTSAFVSNVAYSLGTKRTWLEGVIEFGLFYLRRETIPIYMPLFIIASISSIYMRRHHKQVIPLTIFGVWLLLSIAGAMIGRTLKITYFLQIVPPITIMIAVGLPYILKRSSFAYNILLCLTGITLIVAPQAYLNDWQQSIQGAHDEAIVNNVWMTANYLDDNLADNQCVWFWGALEQIAFLSNHHSCAAGILEQFLMLDDFDLIQNRIDYMEDMFEAPPTLHVSGSPWNYFPMLQQYHDRYVREQIPDLTMPVYRVDTSSWQAINLDIGSLFSVIGVDVFHDEIVCAGDELSYALTWRVHTPPQQYYQMFLHLRRSSDDALITQFDGAPISNYPTQDWHIPGEIVLSDIITLDISSNVTEGDYYVATGFYNTNTLEHLPVTNASGDISNEFTLTTLEIRDCNSN